ncbi:MAG TPA: alanine racemase [Blastocatellia bacterium]|nr:alanine racemase [Blastocatellia bacterium]
MTAKTPGLSLLQTSLDAYQIEGVERVMTPALAIYPEIVDANIRTTLRLLGDDAERWRPHVKTAKLGFMMRRLVEHGIANFKCSTSLELLAVCEAGAADVVVAYPMVGANASRVREVSEQFPRVNVSALVECRDHIEAWQGSRVGLFIDVNPGMNRTGIEQDRVDEIIQLALATQNAGQVFRGLHYYDGHLSSTPLPERESVAHRGYDRLMEVIAAFERAQIAIAEIITAGTPAFPCTLSYSAFARGPFIHRASPGTVVYNDCSSLAQLPSEYGYRPAAVVVSTVVSRPSTGRFTCDAGHKTVSADSGVPTCAVIGHPEFLPSKPSEEHLPIDVLKNSSMPTIGEALYLVPRHICPTVNNFDHALIVIGGRIVGVERVTARGREVPLPL